MFYLQQAINSECVEVTPEIFERIINDKDVDRLCQNARVSYEMAQGYDPKSEEYRKWYDKVGKEKRKLPMFVFMAGLIHETARGGKRGLWRKAEAVHLNGLCLVDIDHLVDAVATYVGLTKKMFGAYEQQLLDDIIPNKSWHDKLGVVLVHVTPSGHGLRFVFKADIKTGNLADNQKAFCKQLGLENDGACKDSSRASFAVPAKNILFLHPELFTYQNDSYEKEFGEDYRRGKSQPTEKREATTLSEENLSTHRGGDSAAGVSDALDGTNLGADTDDPAHRDNALVDDGAPVSEQLESGEQVHRQTGGRYEHSIIKNEDGEECYKHHGMLIPYSAIIKKLVDARGGEPSVGGRNNMLYDLVRLDLRHICDNDEAFCFRVAPDFGLSERERKQTIHQALCATRYGMSRTLRNILASFVVESQKTHDGMSGNTSREVRFNHAEIWNTFKPFLGGVWKPVTDGLDDNLKFAGFLAAGAMFGTYLSAVTLKNFYDHKDWRLSFMVYIIGQAASGKGQFVDLNKLIMTPLILRDEEGRKWEEKYKEDKEKRANSSSNQKAKAMEIEHFPIRVLPGTISNAMRYRRMKDAVRVVNGENIHLHCYIFESELSAKLRSEQGSWAGAQDLDCKSFSNEYGGNDYGNAQAVNGLIEINMNQVITGTHDAMNRKITPRNCMDGLATRLIMFEMPDSSFKMLKREEVQRSVEQTEWLSTIGEDLIDMAGVVDLSQRVRVPKTYQSDYGTTTSLSDALYQWGVDEAARCAETKDICADYFRRRAPIIAARYAVVDAIMNDLANFKTRGKVKIGWRQIDLAVRLASYFQESQMYFFGGKIMSGLIDEAQGLSPQRKVRATTTDLYASLGDVFTLRELMRYIPNYSSATTRIRRWLNDGVVERKKGKGKFAEYRKIKKTL